MIAAKKQLRRGGKISGGEGFRKLLQADGGDNILGFVGKNLILFITLAAAVITTLFAPITRFPANDIIAKVGLVFAFLTAQAGLKKGNADRFLTSLFALLPDRFKFFTPLIIIVTSFIFGAVFTPLGAVLLIIPAITPLCKAWHKTALLFALCLGAVVSSSGELISPAYTLHNVLPLALVGLCICTSLSLLIGKPETAILDKKPVDIVTVSIYFVAFILCVLTAFGILSIIICICSVVLAAVILDSDNIKKIDYGLLVIIFLYAVVSWNILRTDIIALPESSLVAAGLYTYRRYLDTTGAKPIFGLLIFIGVGVGLILVMALSALAAI
ncbi:MAG: hypothetical protein LBM59_03700 [Ruminococcus sp.]|jgi:hypothetical protein|nr:hypothetical protein [Ruminococcus sp.]